MRMMFVPYLLAAASLLLLPTCAQTDSLANLPLCAQTCRNSTVACDSANSISCMCSDITYLSNLQGCLASTCAPKDVFSALDITSTACNMPIRSRAGVYKTVDIVFFALATIVIFGRFAAHYTLGRIQWLNDGNMVVVLALNSVLFATTYKLASNGLGQDIWKVSFNDISSMLRLYWICEIVYFNLIGFIKIAFLLFFLQIFPEKRFRAVIWGFVVINMVSMIAFSFAVAFICTPVSLIWTGWDGTHKGHCGNNNALAFSHAAFSILMDFITLALPFAQIWKLQLKTKKKIGVLLMFSVGAFVTVVSILRLRALVHFARTENITWDYLEAALWSVIEANVGIICACMPSIRLGLVHIFPTMLGSTDQSASKTPLGGRAVGTASRPNAIAVQTNLRVSHTKRPHDDDHGSFVQLVDIKAYANSTDTN